ncbi:MAG: radical SAM protein, partial [Treponema sp.]|nr:radical SAM protein [Treponema sp.]
MSGDTLIDPVRDLGAALLSVEMPARYTGGEYGRLARAGAPFQTAIAFPDLYEIGMSNQALRILYNRLNGLPGVSCDRVFAPAPDFEALLRGRSMPLYALDTGIPLKKLDLLLFTLGYELGISSVLTMLDLAGIPIHREQRGEEDPIVIMGGPCVSNPLPYAAFIDAFWIGEAEAGFFELTEKLAGIKGQGRGESLSVLSRHPSVWTWGKKEALRGIDRDFAVRPPGAAVFPVPSMKVVQHHGAVEIMRGCPNGCRFCHAGFWYRPMRQKNASVVLKETEDFIRKGGYREISLSSLSSGDYQCLDPLVDTLRESFSGAHVSFQLPSLRVSSFSLPLLEKISAVRKSGLTFAVETPGQARQMAINKEVSLDSAALILEKARKNGWRGAKFYFMIGLPFQEFPENRDEAEEIAAFIRELHRRVRMHFNITVGVFVPKPHTPYQRAPQIGIDEARGILDRIRGGLKSGGHKVSISDPLVSLVEGLISRGNADTALLIEDAWRKGCRLDAWQDSIRKDIWRDVFTAYPAQVSRILHGWG